MSKTKRAGIVAALFAGIVLATASPTLARPDAGPDACWVADELLGDMDCHAVADASWEGLDADQQAKVAASGLTGTAFDQLVIDTRDPRLNQPATCQEDQPCWDCSTMGNLICGPARDLPHTL